MNSIRQKLRPKHQVLVLKCYPKIHKGSGADAKPNSSELSYLLYYASTRRSKLQKVCEFLEKKTANDVYKLRYKDVQVTLQILQAIIKRCPRDLPLFRAHVLNVSRAVLKSNDITMVEGSIPTFEALCEHQDSASLAADQDYIAQYEVVINMYAYLATTDVVANRGTVSLPVKTRLRKAGLEAIRAISSSDSLGSETARQLAAILPAILLNLDKPDDDYIRDLEARGEEKDATEKELGLRRRNSISTVKTSVEVDTDADAVAAAGGTTAEADKLAEVEVGLVALEALRNIFKAVNRGQLRLATTSVLRYIASRASKWNMIPDAVTEKHAPPAQQRRWPIILMEKICGWTPVQDRFIVLVCTVEALVRSPIAEDDLEKQVVLASIVQCLLSSSINFIGLSVIDVLIGFIQHMLLLLQLGGATTSLRPHHQLDAFSPTKGSIGAASSMASPARTGSVVMEISSEPTATRRLLLHKLQKSIGALATHVYYVDQVSDMISTILTRLKPSPTSGVASPAAAIEDPAAAADAIAQTVNIQERQGPGAFFSFDTARLTAMAAIKDILLIANSKKNGGPAGAVGRNPVGAEVWSGTEWLLRDLNHLVREAYVESLLVWLELETSRSSLRIATYRRSSSQHRSTNGSNLVKRAVSNASHRDRSPKPVRSYFLPLIHLAIYENAHQYVDSEANILILHLLLVMLVKRLGINAVRYGLPMIMRLQEDMLATTDAKAKVHLGSLIHGYLWAISVQFDISNTTVGRSIQGEISRRSQSGLWGKGIRIPPSSLESIRSNAQNAKTSPPLSATEEIELFPFEDRSALVDGISRGYAETLRSPPTSPSGTPSRSFSTPILVAPVSGGTTETFPPDVREQLLADWTKEAVVSSNGKDSDSSASLSGSKAATSATKNLLAVNIPGAGMNMSDIDLPVSKRNSRRRPHSAGVGLMSGPRSPQGRSHTASPNDSSSQRSAVRVEDLKRALSGSRHISLSVRERRSGEEDDDTGSESMISADFSMSDVSFVTAGGGSPNENSESRKPPPFPAANTNETTVQDLGPDSIPPVPPLPDLLKVSGSSPKLSQNNLAQRPTTAPNSDRNGTNGVQEGGKAKSLKHGSVRSKASRPRNGSVHAPRHDFSSLLNGISVEGDDGREGEGGLAVRPPY